MKTFRCLVFSLFLILENCNKEDMNRLFKIETNDHYQCQSDNHFLYPKYPKLTIKLHKNRNDFEIINVSSDDKTKAQREIGIEEKSKKGTQEKVFTITCYLNDCDTEGSKEDKRNQSKKIVRDIILTVTTNDKKEYHITISYERRYQLMNHYVGFCKIFNLRNITTDLPNGEIVQLDSIKNKLLMTESYSNENTIEIEY